MDIFMIQAKITRHDLNGELLFTKGQTFSVVDAYDRFDCPCYEVVEEGDSKGFKFPLSEFDKVSK